MAYDNIDVPQLLLLNTCLTAADKLVWMILRLDRVNYSGRKLSSPTRLANRINLSRFTIYNSLRHLTATGWSSGKYPDKKGTQSDDCVLMPNLLIRSSLLPRDIVVYGLLQAKPFEQGKFTYRDLSTYAQLDTRTVRRAVLALVAAGWVKMKQENRKAPIHFTLASPVDVYKIEIEKRINTSPFKGEAIGREMLLFLVKQTDFEANSKPHWLTSRVTGALMEVDLHIREYDLVMEFQGEQHYNPTEFSSAEEVARQQARDAEKAELIKDNNKKLIELRDEDLSLEIIQKKLVSLAPFRNLEGLDSIKKYLNERGRCYQYWAKCKKAERAAKQLAAKQEAEQEQQEAWQQKVTPTES